MPSTREMLLVSKQRDKDAKYKRNAIGKFPLLINSLKTVYNGKTIYHIKKTSFHDFYFSSKFRYKTVFFLV